jgi:hypothetical protein
METDEDSEGLTVGNRGSVCVDVDAEEDVGINGSVCVEMVEEDDGETIRGFD